MIRTTEQRTDAGPVSLREAWGDLVDPREWLIGDSSFSCSRLFSHTGDRGDGRMRPVVENEQDLAIIRGTGRLLTETVPAAIGVVKNLTNYCIGTGFTYRAVAKVDGDSQAAGLVNAVARAVDEFLETNDWVGDFERELFVRSRRDGEFFLALYPMSQGPVAVRILEPEQVTEPQNSRALEDWLGTSSPSSWSFGVHTDAGDVQNIHGYHVRWNESGSDWDYLDVSHVEHVKLNVDRNVKRGVSDFYAVRAHLEGAEKLLRNTREGAAVQAAIAFIREHVPGTTSGQIQSLSALNAITDYTQPTKSGGRTRYVSRYEPGTILDVAGGMQYKPGPLGASHGPNFIAIQQAVLRTIGTRWCMPEYMVSGDASNANYSSSLVAESPFVRACEAEQRFYISRFRKILWKMIALEVAAGRFSRWNADLDAIRSLVTIQIDAPTIAVRDQLAEAQTSEIEHRNGVLSKRTWAALAGRDYDVERKNLTHEQSRNPPPSEGGLGEGDNDRQPFATELFSQSHEITALSLTPVFTLPHPLPGREGSRRCTNRTMSPFKGPLMTSALTSDRTATPLLEIAISTAHKVDREAGVIRAVKILGKESRNGRSYSDEALAQAVRLYEGLGVNIDHPQSKSGSDRKFADGFGYLRNVRRQDDGIYGDLVFLKSHVLAEQICEAAERMPQQFGLSHHAEGYIATEQGKTVVEGFERIFSVDIVRNPATNRGLFEQRDSLNTDDSPTVESDSRAESQIAELREQIKQLEAERDARQLLESAGITADATKIKALANLETREERRELIATWPRDLRTRPRSTGPLRESTSTSVIPTDAKSFARAIK